MRVLMGVALVMCLICCKNEPGGSKDYLRWVGDIESDPQLDDPEFQLCNEEKAGQYHNFANGIQYEGEKFEIERIFDEKYKTANVSQESGMIRIRFLVNCKGKAGRFRMIAMDEDYQEKTFDTSISQQLLDITKSLDGWKVLGYENDPRDYYQYLSFKIKDGIIEEILP